jgi:hypothetical protein
MRKDTTSIQDKLGLGPKRELSKTENGTFTLTVTFQAWTEFFPSSIILTGFQVEKYYEWKNGSELIQNIFPELTLDQR